MRVKPYVAQFATYHEREAFHITTPSGVYITAPSGVHITTPSGVYITSLSLPKKELAQMSQLFPALLITEAIVIGHAFADLVAGVVRKGDDILFTFAEIAPELTLIHTADPLADEASYCDDSRREDSAVKDRRQNI